MLMHSTLVHYHLGHSSPLSLGYTSVTLPSDIEKQVSAVHLLTLFFSQ